MDEAHRIVNVDNPEEAAWGIIGRGVAGYNAEQTGDRQFDRLCFVLQTADETITGGVLGELYYGWLHVDLLWVQDELRGQGYGRQLLLHIEEEARQRGAGNAYLDTFSFQAPGFYERLGYESFGELPDFPGGHRRYFMHKQL